MTNSQSLISGYANYVRSEELAHVNAESAPGISPVSAFDVISRDNALPKLRQRFWPGLDGVNPVFSAVADDLHDVVDDRLGVGDRAEIAAR